MDYKKEGVNMLNMRIDNYYISVSNRLMSICLDGQNIIHERLLNECTRLNVAREAIIMIQNYNIYHNCEWGKLPS